ncbi:zinc finger protein 91-like [Mytilus californianus]|uniref:zinc finger protein 91-like n=1 Tax=Mytilus californianus TaxID=6549 RepID=UPI002245B23B|nr:zinc finger protein 91-like [Mytilus californianus]
MCRLFAVTRLLFHWNEEMSEENHSKPTYSEQREIECQTELVNAHYEEEEEEDDDDGLYGLLKLPQDNDGSGQYPSVQDISNINTEQLMKMESLKKNDFTINSKNLLRWTKVITPSKFAEQPVEEASWEILSKTYSKMKKVIHTAGKHKNVIPKKAKTDSKHLRNISLFNQSQANDIVQEEGMFIAESIDATNLENTLIPDQYLGNQTILSNVQNIISSETFSEPNNSFQTTPIQNKQFIAENITQVVIPFEENIVKPEEQYREEENKLEQAVHFLQETVTGVGISQQHLKQENNSQIMKNVQTNTQTYTKQQQPTLNLEKLIETLRNHGKGINTLDHLLSNEEGEIKVNGAPLKFILVEQSEDANLPSTEILTSTNEHDTIGNIKYFVHSSIKADNLSDIPSKKNTYSMPLVSDANTSKEETPGVNDLLNKNFIAGSLDKDKLKADEYHEMLKAANKILRTKVSDEKNLTDKERKYRCDICSASFKKSCNLSAHKRIHNNDRRFSCHICSQKFYVGTKLRSHMRIHTNTKPFVCNICKKAFREKSVLKNHILTHTGKKEFECSICKKKFFRKSKLDIHMRIHSDNKPYKCEHCNRSFAVIYYYRKHVKKHAVKKEFECDICRKGFHLKENYKCHLLSHDKSKRIQCEKCLKTFIKESLLKNHNCLGMPVKSAMSQFLCDQCSNSFSSKSQLLIHLKEHRGEDVFYCKICNKPFLHEYLLKRHKVVHSDKKPYKCRVCKVEFSWISSLRTHIMTKHKDKIREQEKEMKHNDGVDLAGEITEERNRRIGSETEFMEEKSDTQLDAQISPHTENVCAVCNQCFVAEESLKEHYRTHNLDWTSSTKRNPEKLQKLYNKDKFEIKQVVSFQCDRCKKILPETERDSHSSVHARYPFICDFCCMNFEQELYLLKHLEIHKGDKPHRCNLCGEKFATLQQLTTHRQIHEEEENKPIKCDDCGKRFRNNYSLNLHRHIHTNEKPYKCDECTENFSRNDYLKRHKARFHSGQVFQCNSCPKTFYERYELSRHIQSSHVKDKPHICTVCDKKFAFSYELKKHLETHNKNLPFKCNECPNAYEKKKQLNRHFKNKHPGNEKQSVLINKLILCTETESENFGEHIEEEIMKSTPVQSYAAQTDIQTEISTNQIKDLGRIIQESKQIENVKQNNSELNESPSVMRTRSNPPCSTIFRTVDDEVVVNDVDKESGEIAVSPTHQSAQESSNTENEIYIYVDQNTEESKVELPLEVYSDMQNSETTFQYLDPKSGTLYQVSSEESNTYEVVVGIKDDEVDNKDITSNSTENGKTDEKEHSYVKVSNVFIPSTKYEN